MLISFHSSSAADKSGRIHLCLMAKVIEDDEEYPAQASSLLGRSDGAFAADGMMNVSQSKNRKKWTIQNTAFARMMPTGKGGP